MRKRLLIFLAILSGCSGISFRGGPSKTQINEDMMSSTTTCMQPLRSENRPYAVVDSMKITGTKIYGGEATVTVRVEYHWIGTPTTAETFTMVPCNLFNGQSAKNVAEPTLIYKQQGSNWKLSEIR